MLLNPFTDVFQQRFDNDIVVITLRHGAAKMEIRKVKPTYSRWRIDRMLFRRIISDSYRPLQRPVVEKILRMSSAVTAELQRDLQTGLIGAESLLSFACSKVGVS